MKNFKSYFFAVFSCFLIFSCTQENARSPKEPVLQSFLDNGGMEDNVGRTYVFSAKYSNKSDEFHTEDQFVENRSELTFLELMEELQTSIDNRLNKSTGYFSSIQRNIYDLFYFRKDDLSNEKYQKELSWCLDKLIETEAVEWRKMTELFLRTMSVRNDLENKTIKDYLVSNCNKDLEKSLRGKEKWMNHSTAFEEMNFKTMEREVKKAEESLSILNSI
jgi:hypothetical protein